MTLAAGPVWTFWLAVPLAALSLVVLAAMLFGYFKTVSGQRYPKGE